MLCYIFHLKWRIVTQINHCTRKKYYTTNKLPPPAVGDQKAVPKKLLEILFKKTLNKKLNELYKEMDQLINNKDIYHVPVANVQNIYNVIEKCGREVCNIGRYYVLLI